MNEGLTEGRKSLELDAHGALLDADMAAYYTWLNQMRLTGADASAFLVWFEDHAEALVISRSTSRGVESREPIGMDELLDRMQTAI
jgi:glutathione S-transferase